MAAGLTLEYLSNCPITFIGILTYKSRNFQKIFFTSNTLFLRHVVCYVSLNYVDAVFVLKYSSIGYLP